MPKIVRPLRGHPYHGKTDAELRFIVKDAGEAAAAVRDHDAVAEAKYLDQVNDANTMLHYRDQWWANERAKAARGDRRRA
jgi:hypothetical protein